MQTAEEILKQYQQGERPLSKDFLTAIPWQEVKKTEVPQQFIPTLLYMRDVEKFTELYYAQLAHTTTIQDPHIRTFMDQWQHEESLHGDLLNRFLEESGMPSDERWFEKAKEKIPRRYYVTSALSSKLMSLLGSSVTAVHMTWGAINEYSTMNGYGRLSVLAGHPVLSYILNGIMREEARHARFYRQMAGMKLAESPRAQKIARFIVEHFWSPVGQGAKRKDETNHVIKSLYPGKEGMELFDVQVTSLIKNLPGFDGFTTTTKRVAEVVRA